MSGDQESMDKYLAPMDASYTSTPISTHNLEKMKKRKLNSPLKALYESLDDTKSDKTEILCQLLQGLESRLDDLEEINDSLMVENSNLQTRCQVNEGRITRLEKVVEDLREENLQINARAMRDNLVFQGIPENSSLDVKHVLWRFMQYDLKISEEDLETCYFNKVYRVGAPGNYIRSIIANVNDAGKTLIWRHLKNLGGRKISIFPHLPRELAERKRQLLPQFQAANMTN